MRQQLAGLCGVAGDRVERGDGPGGQVRRQGDPAADRYQFVEEPGGLRCGQQRQGIDGPRRLPHQRDVARIAAKPGDVALDEPQRLHDVQQRVVAGIGCLL